MSTRHYQRIDNQKLSLEEKILTIAAQKIDRHTSCTTVGEIVREIIKQENGNPYDMIAKVKQAINKLELDGWLVWERVARLNNIHLVDRKYQQHPVILVRVYRQRR